MTSHNLTAEELAIGRAEAERAADWAIAKAGAERATSKKAVFTTRETAKSDTRPLGFWVAIAGIAVMVVGVFLPEASSTSFPQVAHNTLVQNTAGWIIIVVALACLGMVYRAYTTGNRTFTPIIAGLYVIGQAIYDGTGARVNSARSPTPPSAPKPAQAPGSTRSRWVVC